MLRLFGICSDQHISQFFLLSTYNIHWSKIWTHSVPIVNVHGSKLCMKYETPAIKYDKKHCPAWYLASGDWYHQAYIDYENKITEELVSAGQFREQYEDEDEYDYYENCIRKQVAPYMDHFERTNIASYQCMGACFYWNRFFGLQMARLVEPSENWQIIASDWHATVVNGDCTKVFDILYWNPADVSGTRGGAFAISEATRMDPRP